MFINLICSIILLFFAFSCEFFAGSAAAQNIPRSSHVWVLTEENHSFEDVVGNSQMPYYNHLIKQYG